MLDSAGAGARRTRVAFGTAVAAVAIFDLALRAESIVTRSLALATAEFDEGVYTATAASLIGGDVPYRDFVFVHPPGVSLILAPLAGLADALGSWSDLLFAARWFMAVIAVVNVVLIAYVACRWKGWLAGVIAGVLYASYLPAVHTEGHVMLEPLVTLGVLVSALVWIGSPAAARSDRRAAVVGAVAALTALMKLTGGVTLLALLFVDRARSRVVVALTAGATAGIVLLPFLVLAGPSAVFDQVVVAQLRRPGGDVSGGTIQGTVDRLDHLGSYGPFAVERIPGSAGLIGAALAAVLVVWAWRSGPGIGRFLAAVVAAGSVAILSAPDYYDQYPVTVFAGIAVIVGAAAAQVVDAIRRNAATAGTVAAGAIALSLAVGAADTVVSVADDARGRVVSDPAATIADIVGDECVAADLPEVLLTLDRLPPRDRSGDRLVDPFGTLVRAALRHDDYATTAEAVHSPRAQERLRQALIACPYAVTKGSLEQLPPRWSTSTRAWFLDHFEVAARNEAALMLWRRNDDR